MYYNYDIITQTSSYPKQTSYLVYICYFNIFVDFQGDDYGV